MSFCSQEAQSKAQEFKSLHKQCKKNKNNLRPSVLQYFWTTTNATKMDELVMTSVGSLAIINSC